MELSLDACYAALDVPPDASPADLKKARRELAMIWHPDRFADHEGLRLRAEKTLMRINQAYDALTAHREAEAARIASQTIDLGDLEPDADDAPEDAVEVLALGRVPMDETVLAWSLGLRVGPDRFAEVLVAGTTAPCAASTTFTNAHDWQDEIGVEVIYGERDEVPANCSTLGRFAFVDLPPRPRGLLRMLVTFSVDETGAVGLSALDLDSGSPIRVASR